ncbi:hypothetical protein KKC91_10955 [bacterium]|nr:hypothetical protein [bacterium]
MIVKNLIKLLKTLDQNAVIDMSSDEEGNSFGDISENYAELTLKDGRKAYGLYPMNSEEPGCRYKF